MPEGPECRIMSEYLTKVLEGKTINDWVFSGGKYTDVYPEGFNEFDMALPLLVVQVSCKGKFIYFKLVNDKKENFYILHSLMVTGKWQKKYDDCCKWFLEIDTGETLWFRDPRGFGTLKFTTSFDAIENKLNKLGPDIMGAEFKLPLFKELIIQYSNRNITTFLMDQEVISGCGNYIKAEVLHYAKISPLRKTGTLTMKETELLYEALRIVPRVVYNNFGIFHNDYEEDNSVFNYTGKILKIYGQKTAKRSRTADGRITYWDPTLQL